MLLSRPGPPPAPTGADKTSLVAFIRHDHTGALLEVLTEFAVRGVNLTRIESRPTGERLGRYCFSVDCEGHVADARVGDALGRAAPDLRRRPLPRLVPAGRSRRAAAAAAGPGRRRLRRCGRVAATACAAAADAFLQDAGHRAGQGGAMSHYPPITPHLAIDDVAGGAGLLPTAFGARSGCGCQHAGRPIAHAELDVNGGLVTLGAAIPEYGLVAPDTDQPVQVAITVFGRATSTPRTERAVERRGDAACPSRPTSSTATGPPPLRCPFGHKWILPTHLRDVSARGAAAAAHRDDVRSPPPL